MNKMRSRQDLIDLREACIKSMSAETKKILVCGGTGCVAGGALDIFARLKELMVERDIAVEVELADEPHGDVVGIKRSGCHGFCEMGPLVRIEPQGWLYTKVKVEDCEEIVEKTIAGGECVDRLAYRQNGEIYRRQEDIPFYARQHRVVLEHCGHINALSIREYLAMGGYKALEKALFEMTSAEILDEVEDTKVFPQEILKKMAQAGFFGIKVPVKYGGQGSDHLAYVVTVEEIARVSAVGSLYVNSPNSLGGMSILVAGTEEQKLKYLC